MKLQKSQIPQNIKNFINDNNGYFEGEIEIDDIDVCSVCYKRGTKEKVIYKATCIYENGAYILEWELNKEKARIFLNGELIMDEKNNCNLDYRDITNL